jgi:hypothetical protein
LLSRVYAGLVYDLPGAATRREDSTGTPSLALASIPRTSCTAIAEPGKVARGVVLDRVWKGKASM